MSWHAQSPPPLVLCRDILNGMLYLRLNVMACCISTNNFFPQQLCAPCTQRVPTHVPAWRKEALPLAEAAAHGTFEQRLQAGLEAPDVRTLLHNIDWEQVVHVQESIYRPQEEVRRLRSARRCLEVDGQPLPVGLRLQSVQRQVGSRGSGRLAAEFAL